MDEVGVVSVAVAVLIPAAVMAFYVWQVAAWIAACSRWRLLHAGVPVPLRSPMPPFMDGMAWQLARLFQCGSPLREFLGERVVGTLSWLHGAMLAPVAFLVMEALAPAFGGRWALTAGAIVVAGVWVPTVKAINRFYRLPPRADPMPSFLRGQ